MIWIVLIVLGCLYAQGWPRQFVRTYHKSLDAYSSSYRSDDEVDRGMAVIVAFFAAFAWPVLALLRRVSARLDQKETM